MQLILHDMTPIHWAVAGAVIAAVTLTMLFVGNRRLGISTGFEDACGLVLNAPYFRRSGALDGRTWRLPFLGGLVLGGVLSAVLGGGWEPTWALGMFDTEVGWGPTGKVMWMFVYFSLLTVTLLTITVTGRTCTSQFRIAKTFE